MKRTHKGFTLVELLIVVAVVGVLAAMMTMSSTDAVDSAGANVILSNLNSLKTAAYQMYINEDLGMASIVFAGTATVGSTTSDVTTTLKKYLGKNDLGTSYGLVGDTTAWYVVYALGATDSAGVKNKLYASASKAELLGAGANDIDTLNATTTTYYDNTKTGDEAQKYIALKVR